MKNNKRILTKIVSIILIAAIVISVANSVLANGVFLDASAFDTVSGKAEKVTSLANTAAGTVASVLRIAGVCIAVVMLLTIAMKYMISSAGDRADLKKHAVAYVVGAVVLFGATNIIATLVEFTNNALGSA